MTAVDLVNIGKEYALSCEKQALVRFFFPKLLRIRSFKNFWALKEVNLKIQQGQTLGVLGRNGAGKTTLLNIIAGIVFPTQGRVAVNGMVSALLGLGAGFHPELTGEENIYINGSILGLKNKEIRKRFDEIVGFSGLGHFITAPLHTYSTGMYLRLGFSIAVNVDFDILLIDEILGVGDISFQRQCLDKITHFQRENKTIILVSQDMNLINKLCSRAVLLDAGRIVFEGEPEEAAEFYQKVVCGKELTKSISGSQIPKEAWGIRMGTGEVEIVAVKLLNDKNQESGVFKTAESMKVNVKYFVHSEVRDPHFGVAIFKEDGTYCYGPNTRLDGIKIDKLNQGEGEFTIEYKNLNLLPGEYRISVAIWDKEENFAYDHHYAFYRFEVISQKRDHGIVYLEHSWRL